MIPSALRYSGPLRRRSPSGRFSLPPAGIIIALLSVYLAGSPLRAEVTLEQVGFLPGVKCEDVFVHGTVAYVAADTGGLKIIDVSDPAAPAVIGSYFTPGSAFGVFYQNRFAYIAADTAGLRVIDVGDSLNPVEAGFIDTPGQASQVYVDGNYAYVADGPGGLRVIDISDPTHPVEVGCDTLDYAHDVFVLGHRAYVAADNVRGTDGSIDGLRIYDISDLGSPAEINSVPTPGNAYGVYVTDKHAYVADDTEGLRIIAGIDSSGQVEYGSLVTPGYANQVSVRGEYAFMTASTCGLYVIDVSNAHHPFQAAFFPIDAGHVRGVFATEDYIYLCNNDPDYGGLYVLRLNVESEPSPPEGELVGYWPFNKGNGTIAYDSTGNGHDGAIEGAAWHGEGVRDACLSFENGYVRIGAEGDDGVMSYETNISFTWALWINPGEMDSDRKVIMSRRMLESSPDSMSMNISYVNHSILVRIGAYPASSSELYSIPVLTEGRWYHIAVVRDVQAGQYKLYIDGTVYDTAMDYGADLSAPASMWIGQDPVSPEASEQFRGLIDEVMIYNRALSLSEIEDLASWVERPVEDNITVVSPNGGESWIVGSTHNIQWTSTGEVWPVTIAYSTDGGANWMGVADSTANDGGFTWNIPPYPSPHCLVRVLDLRGSPSDVSDAEFTISDTTGLHFAIRSVTDNPNDQGKQARVRWTRHVCDSADTPASALVIGYSVWRKIDPERESALPRPRTTPDGLWEQVGLTPAVQDTVYALVVPTIADSTIASGMYYSIFFVRAHTAYPTVHYETAPDSGWSADNLVPAAPVAAGRRLATGVNRIEWSEPVDEDFNYFRIFRGELSGFQPAADSPLAATADNWYEDTAPEADKFYYYRIAAVDFSGNMGPCSEEIAVSLTGIDGGAAAIPDRFELEQNYPNPFNPETAIRFALPEDAAVSLRVYNIFGQLVRTLRDERLPAGYHQVRWDGKDDLGREVGSGVYFYSIEAGDFRRVRRMVLLK